MTVIFYKDKWNEANLRKLGLNERQIKAVMYVKEKGKITNKEYTELNRISRQTATRDLTEMVEEKIFILSGKGKRNLYYGLSEAKMSQ